MAIRLEFFSLIVPITKIDQHYPGGFKTLVAQHGSMFGVNLWHDEYLFRDGAMSPTDVRDLMEFWETKGLVPFEERDGKQCWKDMCVVDYFDGPTLPCDWLEYDSTDFSVSFKGKPKGKVIGREEMHSPNNTPVDFHQTTESRA